jgi:hypothetical protein
VRFVQERAVEYIEANSRLKGEKKLTIQLFAGWLNKVLLPECYLREDGTVLRSLSVL